MDRRSAEERKRGLTESLQDRPFEQDIEKMSSKSITATNTAGDHDENVAHDYSARRCQSDPQNLEPAEYRRVRGGVSPDESKPTWIKQAAEILRDQWFLVALALLISMASQVQVSLKHQEQKRTLTSYICISLIFFVYVPFVTTILHYSR